MLFRDVFCFFIKIFVFNFILVFFFSVVDINLKFKKKKISVLLICKNMYRCFDFFLNNVIFYLYNVFFFYLYIKNDNYNVFFSDF